MFTRYTFVAKTPIRASVKELIAAEGGAFRTVPNTYSILIDAPIVGSDLVQNQTGHWHVALRWVFRSVEDGKVKLTVDGKIPNEYLTQEAPEDLPVIADNLMQMPLFQSPVSDRTATPGAPVKRQRQLPLEDDEDDIDEDNVKTEKDPYQVLMQPKQLEFAPRGKAGVYTAEEEAELRRLMAEHPDATPSKIYKIAKEGDILKGRKKRSIATKITELKKI